LYQNATNSQVWIYPSMRRGGRTVYGLDVSTPSSPAFKWKAGCPDLTDNTGCGITKSDGTFTAGLTNIGQTWSTPVVAFIKGYSTTSPVVIFGGGYDSCEDANTSTPSCGSTTGNAIYILDASTGALVASYSTTRAVAADVSVLDIDSDGYVDYAYAADTGGNIYRMDFVDGPTTRVALSTTLWNTSAHFHEVAHTNGSGRKFLFGPALLANSGQVYLAIGSGDREHPLQTQYPYTTPVVNRFYVYLDDLSSSTTNGNLDDTTIMYDRTTGADCSSTQVLPGGATYKGWFITLNQHGTGEQVVTGAVIAGGLVTFSTNRPVPTPTGSCSTVLGEARGYLVNLYSGSGAIGVNGSCGGSQSGVFVQGGLPPTPVLASVPINGTVQSVLIGAIQKDNSTSTTISPQKITPPINAKRKRVYWKKSGDAN
jgi:Tfp pilus tip-associated adhesin PilY1